MQIVDKQEHYDEFLDILSKNEYFIYPIFSDTKYHPANNIISVLLVSFEEKDFVLMLNHSDSLFEIDQESLFKKLNTVHRKFTFGKKELLHKISLDNVFDLTLVLYLKDGDVAGFENLITPAHLFYKRMYREMHGLNRIVPILNHVEFLYKIKNIYLSVDKEFGKDFQFYNDTVLPSLFGIEKSGMAYNEDVFEKYFLTKKSYHKINKDFLFCQFRPYSTTGRPSNTFGGINFAALKKESGERKMIRSRFTDGMLVEFDFDSYHHRLIAERIGYDFPTDIRVHEYFGKYFFQKETLTDEEYEESKAISFRLLYGGIDNAFLHIPYFKQVDDLIYRLWDKFNRVGFIESPISHKKVYKENLDEMNKYKLWNYFIQLIETETSIRFIHEIIEKIVNNNIYLILYTYDSFLFDIKMSDIDKLIEVKNILEKDNYPVRVSYGLNYHNMKKLAYD